MLLAIVLATVLMKLLATTVGWAGATLVAMQEAERDFGRLSRTKTGVAPAHPTPARTPKPVVGQPASPLELAVWRTGMVKPYERFW